MFSLRSFARSTLGELKDALIDNGEIDDDEDDETDEEGENCIRHAESTGTSPGPPQPLVTLQTSMLQRNTGNSSPDIPAATKLAAVDSVDDAAMVGCSLPNGQISVPAIPNTVAVCKETIAKTSLVGDVALPQDRGSSSTLEESNKNGFLAQETLEEPGAPKTAIVNARLPELVGGTTLGKCEVVPADPKKPELTLADVSRANSVTIEQRVACEPDTKLCDDIVQAQRHFEALLTTPGLVELLVRECGWDSITTDPIKDLPMPNIAARCSEALRLFAPRLLVADENSDKHHLLASFSERYDSLLTQYDTLQQRYREMMERETDSDKLAQQIHVWESAHQTAATRIEELTMENISLKERIHKFESRGIDPNEKRELLQKLAQRDAEIRAAGEALQQLQEVMDDGAGATSIRCVQLERELRDAQRALGEAEAARRAESVSAREARDLAAGSSAREQELVARCQAAENEVHENGAALEALLQEKSRHLDEREHLVDKRLVTSMLALYLDHLASGQQGLAEQALNQTLQVLGGAPAVAERQRFRVSSEVRPAEPLGDAFLDFLTRETTEEIAPAAT